MDAEADEFLKGQPDALAARMTAPTTMAYLTSAEGAGDSRRPQFGARVTTPSRR
jgi:hypothetical protein